MKAMKRVLSLLLTLSMILLPACGNQTAPAASPSTTPASTASHQPAPAPSSAPAAESGRLLDRKGQLLDLAQYPALSAAEESFAVYLQMGCDVQLTIDLALQQQAQTLLAETLGYGNGAAVMVDVKTGEPLVLASNRPDRSPALLSAYQPGNLFLPCTAIAALYSNIISPDWEIQCQGLYDRYQQDGWVSECWIWSEGNTHPAENVTTALRDSCHYYFYTVGNDLGNMMLVDCAESLGLGQPTGIELPEVTGTLASRRTPLGTGEKWRIGDTLEAAVGRSTSAFTPLQMAEYCAAIANKGQRYSASVLSSVAARDGTVLYTRQPKITGNVLNEKEQELAGLLDGWRGLLDTNWDAIHQGMYAALNDQTVNRANAFHWQDCPWQVAGMADKNLFMGYAPFEEPQVAISVVAGEAENSAPAQQIARELLNIYIQSEE